MTRRPLVLLIVFFGTAVFLACGDDAPPSTANDAMATDGGVSDGTDGGDATTKVDAALGCPELCDRALECLNLAGQSGSRSSCMAWCNGKVATQAVGACELCFETERCADIFKDPLSPWDLTHMNPGACIEECGLGTCESDGECASADELCMAVGDTITCASAGP